MVKLALLAVDQVGRRVQQDTTGHRGLPANRYRARLILRRRHDRPTTRQAARLKAALLAGDPNDEVTVAWIVAQRLMRASADGLAAAPAATESAELREPANGSGCPRRPRRGGRRCCGIALYFGEVFYKGYTVAGDELGLLPDADPADGALTDRAVDDVDRPCWRRCARKVEHTPVSDVANGIVTATVRIPQGSVLGLIFNPHFQLRDHP